MFFLCLIAHSLVPGNLHTSYSVAADELLMPVHIQREVSAYASIDRMYYPKAPPNLRRGPTPGIVAGPRVGEQVETKAMVVGVILRITRPVLTHKRRLSRWYGPLQGKTKRPMNRLWQLGKSVLGTVY